MEVADLWCGERVNPRFEGCRGRNLETFFLKPEREELDAFVSRAKVVAEEVDFVAVPGCLVERKVLLSLLPVLRRSRVAVAPYYHSPQPALIEKSKRELEKLEKYGVRSCAEFLPTYDPKKGIIIEGGREEVVNVIPISPLGELEVNVESSEFGLKMTRVLEILAKTEKYSRYYRRDIWERFMSTEFVFSATLNFEKFLEIVSCYQQRCARWMRSKLSAMAMRTLPLSKGFRFSAGIAIDLEEFCRLVEEVGDGEFEGYITREDFSRWIEVVLRDKRLAEKVRECKNRKELLRVIRDRMKGYRL